MKQEVLTCDVCKKKVSQLCDHVTLFGVEVLPNTSISFTCNLSFVGLTITSYGSCVGTYPKSVDICQKCAEKAFLKAVKEQFKNNGEP